LPNVVDEKEDKRGIIDGGIAAVGIGRATGVLAEADADVTASPARFESQAQQSSHELLVEAERKVPKRLDLGLGTAAAAVAVAAAAAAEAEAAQAAVAAAVAAAATAAADATAAAGAAGAGALAADAAAGALAADAAAGHIFKLCSS
jgi:hypothetical protein